MKLFKWIGDWWTEKKRLRAALAAAEAEGARQVRLVQEQLKQSDEMLAKEVKRRQAAQRDQDSLLVALQQMKEEKRPHVVKVAERAMKEEDLQGELAVDDENPMWRAVHQLLDREIGKQVDTVATIAGEKRIEAAGGIAALMEFQTTLLDYQKAGRAAEEKESEGVE